MIREREDGGQGELSLLLGFLVCECSGPCHPQKPSAHRLEQGRVGLDDGQQALGADAEITGELAKRL